MAPQYAPDAEEAKRYEQHKGTHCRRTDHVDQVFAIAANKVLWIWVDGTGHHACGSSDLSRNGYGRKTTKYVGMPTYDNCRLCLFLLASCAFNPEVSSWLNPDTPPSMRNG